MECVDKLAKSLPTTYHYSTVAQCIAAFTLLHVFSMTRGMSRRLAPLQANDTYLQMAIGNAAWPIGVTMVGIHARTGREKIFSKHVAHVMNDETQRKFIQGLKRLMTKCQEFYPTDPSAQRGVRRLDRGEEGGRAV